MHKKQLYLVFDEYTAKQTKDWKVWRLIARIKGILKESPNEIKEIKFKELRSMMALNWENEIETCEKVERGVEEILKLQ